MKKKLFLSTGVLVLLIIAFLFLMIPKNHLVNNPPLPSLTPKANPNSQQPTTPSEQISNRLKVISVNPPDKFSDARSNQTITLTFNKSVIPEYINFSISPSIPFTLTSDKNTLVINFSAKLSSSTTYVYTINYPDSLFYQSFSFITGSINSTLSTDNAVQQNADWSKKNESDLYLYNQTPYDTPDFSIIGSFSSQPNNHFAFIVTLKGIEKSSSKQFFLDWIKSLGLTDEQIKSLDFSYQ